MQFRALDYGMEACELMVSLPAHHTARDGATEATGEPSFVVSGLPITMRLWQLDMSFSLDEESISYRNQPRILRDIAEFSVTNLPMTFNYNFTCKMEEVLTFKLGCQSPECHVEWWQDSGYPGDPFFRVSRESGHSLLHSNRNHVETTLVTLIFS